MTVPAPSTRRCAVRRRHSPRPSVVLLCLSHCAVSRAPGPGSGACSFQLQDLGAALAVDCDRAHGRSNDLDAAGIPSAGGALRIASIRSAWGSTLARPRLGRWRAADSRRAAAIASSSERVDEHPAPGATNSGGPPTRVATTGRPAAGPRAAPGPTARRGSAGQTTSAAAIQRCSPWSCGTGPTTAAGALSAARRAGRRRRRRGAPRPRARTRSRGGARSCARPGRRRRRTPGPLPPSQPSSARWSGSSGRNRSRSTPQSTTSCALPARVPRAAKVARDGH